ncbi:hypothetical protein GCM10007424_23430 [Flavobacterium suaedae]|uniref:Uncharacterized protein n=1 Tax=Flavobacterium suaedae TaxID=1767027 RepID=A0ABQ1K451_9FLAO|nr:hypothetical protein [Flavobacterium suaedae]GGB82712.1 hypothetical protein GCM10007424_23430 [Flavobacterium suaedae]
MTRLKTKKITVNFLQRKSADFFRGKRAIVKSTLFNGRGETLAEGTIVFIRGKNHDLPTSCLDIKHDETKIKMDCVFCENLELIENPEEIEVNNPEILQ